MISQAGDLARRLAREAEAVCRHYLSNGCRRGRYWSSGDVDNTPGRSLYVRLSAPTAAPVQPANGPIMLRRELCCGPAIGRCFAGDRGFCAT